MIFIYLRGKETESDKGSWAVAQSRGERKRVRGCKEQEELDRLRPR
ncbi:unnamed protein product, partial [Vitis vinifera]